MDKKTAISYSRVTVFTPELTEALNRLLKQLNANATLLTDEIVQSMIAAPANHLILARNEETNKIVGMATLIVYRIPYVMKAILEDVVVDAESRGMGIGSGLVRKSIEEAKKAGVTYLMLTSNPAREEANQLYQRLGFEKRETNVYRIMF